MKMYKMYKFSAAMTSEKGRRVKILTTYSGRPVQGDPGLV